MSTSRLEAVLLDIDGTLVDSNDAHAMAWVDALSESGYQVAVDRVRSLIGKGGDKLLAELVGVEKESDLGRELDRRRNRIFAAKYLPDIRPFPCVRALLERMHGDGLRLVVATSASAKDSKALLEKTGAADLLFQTTSSNEAERSKPDPDIVHAALGKANCPPWAAVMLGDTPYDVEAAGRAGVRSVALRSGGWSDEDLRGAIAIYDDLRSLVAQYEQSPFWRLRFASGDPHDLKVADTDR